MKTNGTAQISVARTKMPLLHPLPPFSQENTGVIMGFAEQLCGDWSVFFFFCQGPEGFFSNLEWTRGLREASWWFTNLLGNFPGVIWNWSPYPEVRERRNKEADHSRLVGGRLHKGIFYKASIDRCDKQISACTPDLKVYMESSN